MLVLLTVVTFAADPRPAQPYFPDVAGYKTLVCDFHTHTVFSDGSVWPDVRIDEARREGIDVIAISDHIEHQPRKNDLPTNHERPHEIALGKAEQLNVLLIKGAEITKGTPPGHYNAIMVTAIGPLNEPNVLDGVRIASEQKAFVFWNHHTWQGEDRGQWQDVQTIMYQNKWLHGLEVANGSTYYPQAHQWCLDKNLTMLGNSDIHGPSIDYRYTPDKHRTLTLVLAKERSLDAVREALFARRTLVWHGNRLIGRPEHLKLIFDAGVTASPVHLVRGRRAYFEIVNRTMLDLQLVRSGKLGPWRINVPAGSAVVESVEIDQSNTAVTLDYIVENLRATPEAGLAVRFQISRP
jgi:hypothetical protein